MADVDHARDAIGEVQAREEGIVITFPLIDSAVLFDELEAIVLASCLLQAVSQRMKARAAPRVVVPN